MVDFEKNSGQLSEAQGQLLVGLAIKTIAEKLKPASQEEGSTPGDSLQESIYKEQRGVFVTLHLKGQLRGCIGSLSGTAPIAEGVRDNAINAAFNDFRFSPLTAAELDEIDVEVSILSELQPLSYDTADDLVRKLRPDVDGVVIKKGGMSATFLPQVWKQLPSVEGFLSHLCQKAGLPVDEWQRGELEVTTYQVQCFTKDRVA